MARQHPLPTPSASICRTPADRSPTRTTPCRAGGRTMDALNDAVQDNPYFEVVDFDGASPV